MKKLDNILDKYIDMLIFDKSKLLCINIILGIALLVASWICVSIVSADLNEYIMIQSYKSYGEYMKNYDIDLGVTDNVENDYYTMIIEAAKDEDLEILKEIDNDANNAIHSFTYSLVGIGTVLIIILFINISCISRIIDVKLEDRKRIVENEREVS